MNIISGHMGGLVDALEQMGYRDLQSIVWLRSPVRINGVWHCKVKV